MDISGIWGHNLGSHRYGSNGVQGTRRAPTLRTAGAFTMIGISYLRYIRSRCYHSHIRNMELQPGGLLRPPPTLRSQGDHCLRFFLCCLVFDDIRNMEPSSWYFWRPVAPLKGRSKASASLGAEAVDLHPVPALPEPEGGHEPGGRGETEKSCCRNAGLL